MTRLSKKASAANLSLDGGLQDCRRVAGELGAAVIAERIDNGVSGSIRQRKGLKAWLEDATSRSADVLIAPHSDRITRTGLSSQSGQIMDMLKGLDPETGKQVRAPIRLVTVSSSDGGRIDTSVPGGLEKLEQEFAAAAVELRRITQRNRQNRARLVAAGRYAGGPVPAGCRVVERDGGKFVESDPQWASVVRRGAERVVGGTSPRAVAVEWQAAGLPVARTDAWSTYSVYSTLLSETTARLILGPALAKALRERLPKPGEKTPEQRGSGGRPSTRLLVRGNGLCGSCGRPLVSSGGAYRCCSFMNGKPCPSAVSIRAVFADEVVEARFLEKWGDLPFLELRTEVDGADHLDAAVVELETSQARMLDDPSPETAEAYRLARDELEHLQATASRVTTTYIDAGMTLGERWRGLTTEEKRDELAVHLAEPVKVVPVTERKGNKLKPERIVTVWRDEVPDPYDPHG